MPDCPDVPEGRNPTKPASAWSVRLSLGAAFGAIWIGEAISTGVMELAMDAIAAGLFWPMAQYADFNPRAKFRAKGYALDRETGLHRPPSQRTRVALFRHSCRP